MRSLYLLFLLLLVTAFRGEAQCPSVSFAIPDTLCAGTTLLPINNSAGANPLLVNWDFNAGDSLARPNGFPVGTYATALVGNLGIDYAVENGNYIAITSNQSGTLTRFEFGNSLSNTPVVTSLGNLGVLGSLADFRLISDNGNWYGLTNSLGGAVFRIDFGTSLLNTPTAVPVTVGGGLFALPYYMSLEKIKNNYVAVISNYTGNSLTVLDFGSSMLNTAPVAFNVNLTSANPISAVIGVDCDNIYAFVGYASGSAITRVSFGTTLSQSPTINDLTLPGVSYRRIDLLFDGAGYSIFAHQFNGAGMHLYDFGNDMADLSPKFTDLGTFSILASGAYAFTITKIGSQIEGLVTNDNTGNLGRFSIPQGTSGDTMTSMDFNPSVTYTQPGYYKIALSVTDSVTGAMNSFTDSIYINPLPQAGFTFANACEGAAVQLTDTSATQGSQSNWTFSSGGNSSGPTTSWTFPSAGSYGVTLESISPEGCSAVITDSLFIYELPVVQFTFTDNECAELDLLFQNTSSVNTGGFTSFAWDFGDTFGSSDSSPVHQYALGGTYQVVLEATANGCTDSLAQTITVKDKPIAAFSTASTCIGENTSFINTSGIPNGIALTYQWDFGDTGSSNLENPLHTYPLTQGNYIAELIVNAANGCSDTVTAPVRIGNKAQVNFQLSTDTACAGNPVQFTNISVPAPGETITGIFWDFGDGTVDSLNSNPSHSYQVPGNYTISLTVTSGTACDSTLVQSIYVISSPDAQLVSDTICEGTLTSFLDLSTTPVGSVLTQWDWEFGDATGSTQASPQHLYADSGYYNVQLTVTNNIGCFNTDSIRVRVKEKPVAAFTTQLACSELPVQFNDSSYGAAAITFWNWDFGNGQFSQVQNPQVIFSQAGAFGVQLIATNAEGCSDTLLDFTAVYPTPDFTITTSDNCLGTSNTFNYNPSGVPPANAGFLWNFGDSQFDSQPNTLHTYTTPGNYSASLTVTDLSNSCSRTLSDTLVIHPKPIAAFSSDSSCVGGTLDFTNLSTILSGTINYYSWTFGNYGNSVLINPNIQVNTADSFPVKLVATSDYGCKDSVVNYAEVYPLPQTAFTASAYFGAPPFNVSFTNLSDAGAYTWDFGDNTSVSNATNPLHIFADTGIYVTTLTTLSARGCSATYSNTITVLRPLIDLALENISFTQTNGYWEIGATVKNQGNITLTSFNLRVQLDGKSVFAELFTDQSLAPGQSQTLTFSTRFPVASDAPPEYLCVTILDVNNEPDWYTSNNEKCYSYGSGFALVELYPNPADDYLNLALQIPDNVPLRIRITDSSGKFISNDLLEGKKGFSSYRLSCAGLSAGIYLMQLETDTEQLSTRFVKK